jgi:3'(2'), 5'-bisphosphate nucleotidase
MEEFLSVINASVDAGLEILEIYNSDDFDVSYKEGDMPLTRADLAANAIIQKVLEPTNIPIISEENKTIDYSIRKDWEKCWIVDPLDGTKEFIKRNGDFTVNIALIEKGKPVFGVIYVPVSKELYIGNVKANKSFLVKTSRAFDSFDELISNYKEITPSQDCDVLKVVGSKSHMNDQTQKFVDDLKETSQKEVEIVSRGSSLKFCLVASGQAQMYPRFAPTMEWDTAAGQAICEAVGLKVIDRTTNDSLLYNREDLLNPHFLVTS